MSVDIYLFNDNNIIEQLKIVPYTLGYYTLRFYTEKGKPVNKVTDEIAEFYLYPTGGTLRDRNSNIVFYNSKFDTYRGFPPPHSEKPRTT